MKKNIRDSITKLGEDIKIKAINLFPVESFPQAIQHIINETNRVNQFPKDFTGIAILAAAGAAIGNSTIIDIDGQYTGISVLFTAGVGDPSVNKSAPFVFAFNPLQNKDDNSYAEYERDNQEFDRIAAMNDKERKEQNLQLPIKPCWKKILMDDYTPESLIEKHKFNKRGLCVYKDELASFFGNFNRYTKGSGEDADYLKFFNGGGVSVDRKGAASIKVKKTCISVSGTIQPDVLEDMASGNRGKNGFMYRFLFAYPSGLKKESKNKERISPTVAEKWEGIVNILLSIPLATDQNCDPFPAKIPVSKEADDLHTIWYEENKDLTNGEISNAIKGIYGKLEIYVYRLALIIQLLNWSTGEGVNNMIEAKAMQAAIKLIEYFRATALKVQGILNNENPFDKYGNEIKIMYEALPDTFKTGEGVKISLTNKIPERTFKRLLNDKSLFTKQKRGNWDKNY